MASTPWEAHAVDVDGDGSLDLVTANLPRTPDDASSPSTVSIFMNNGAGHFADRVDLEVASDPPTDFRNNQQALALADMDADGDQDIVTRRGTFLFNLGDGTFQRRDYTDGGGAILACDLDRDGLPDLISISGTALSYRHNLGAANFSVKTDQLSARYDELLCNDLNRDGALDLLVANSESVLRFLNDGLGSLQGPKEYSIGANYPGKGTYLLADDLNRDGYLDVLSITVDGWATVLLNQGDGDFEPPLSYLVSNFIAIADLNGDKAADLIGVPEWAPEPGAPLSIAINRGDGTFLAPKVITGGVPMQVIAADFDGNGTQDLM